MMLRLISIPLGRVLGLAILIAVGLFGVVGCDSAPRVAADLVAAEPSGMPSAYYLQKAQRPSGQWAILLPGASGLTIFNDERHYIRAATALNERGIDVIVIDYKRAYRAATNAPPGETGEKIAWVVGEAIRWARERGAIASNRGVLVAWSLGAEGLWQLLPNRDGLASLGVDRAVAYYPAHESKEPIRSEVPLLLLVGEEDDVTPLAELRAVLPSGATSIELVSFPGAHHGFDIESLSVPRRVSLIPVIGPSGTFAYQREAAMAASERLAAFLATGRTADGTQRPR